MKKILLYILSLICISSAPAGAQSFEVDTSFKIGTGFDGLVRAIDVQTDGKVVVAGDFQYFNGHYSPRIARLNADGSFDNTFISPIDPSQTNVCFVDKVKIQANGQILIGGIGIVAIDSQIIGIPVFANFARLDPGGSFDMVFTQNAFNASYGALGIPPGVSDFILQNDGNIIYSFNNIGITRLLNNGNLNITACGVPYIKSNTLNGFYVKALMLQNDNNDILFYGGFDTVLSGNNVRSARKHTATFLNNLCINPAIVHTIDTGVRATLRLGNNAFLLGGSFTTYDSRIANKVAKIDNSGNLDQSFLLSSRLSCNDVLALETCNGKILIGAVNGFYAGIPMGNLGICNTDGTFDAASTAALIPNAPLYSIKADNSGYVYCGGDFLTFSFLNYPRICRLKNKVQPAAVPSLAAGKPVVLYQYQGFATLETSEDIQSFCITDLLGQVAYRQNAVGARCTYRIDLRPGIYIVRAYDRYNRSYAQQFAQL